jgi:hypothetical protein
LLVLAALLFIDSEAYRSGEHPASACHAPGSQMLSS